MSSFGIDDYAKRFAQSGICLAREEAPKCLKYVETVKAYLHGKARDFIKRFRHLQLLNHYGADGTPMRTMSRFDGQLESGRRFQRAGKSMHEFLIQLGLLKRIDQDGNHEMCSILKDLIPLDAGKGGWNCYTAMVDFSTSAEAKASGDRSESFWI